VTGAVIDQLIALARLAYAIERPAAAHVAQAADVAICVVDANEELMVRDASCIETAIDVEGRH
jgi:hypothetical protein